MKAACIGAVVTLAILASGAARAARADDKIDCKSQNLNQIQLDQCAGNTFDAADKKLNALYRELMSKYDATDQSLLKAAEKSWLAYRDAECAFETNSTAGGTINSMEQTICDTAKTNERIKELNTQLHCEEGDLQCNQPVK